MLCSVQLCAIVCNCALYSGIEFSAIVFCLEQLCSVQLCSVQLSGWTNFEVTWAQLALTSISLWRLVTVVLLNSNYDYYSEWSKLGNFKWLLLQLLQKYKYKHKYKYNYDTSMSLLPKLGNFIIAVYNYKYKYKHKYKYNYIQAGVSVVDQKMRYKEG